MTDRSDDVASAGRRRSWSRRSRRARELGITHAINEHLLEDQALDAAVRSVRVAGAVAGAEMPEEQEARKPA